MIKKKFDALRTDVAKVDNRFGDFSQQFADASVQFSDLLDRFSAEHGHVYDEGTARRVLALLDILQTKAIVPYAARDQLREIAAERKRSKTPPGFKDDGDGDFYVWADLLTGLDSARRHGTSFERVALISHDQKVDWSRGGVPHPILVAEMKALFNVPFEIWTITRLVEEVALAT